MRKLDGEFRFALEKSMPVLFGYVTLGLGYGLYTVSYTHLTLPTKA